MEVALIYGPYVGVLSTILVAALAVWGQRWATQKQVRLAVEVEQTAAAPGLEEGLRVVTGTLVAEGERVALEPLEPAGIVVAVVAGDHFHTVAAQGLALEVEGERIPVVGEVELKWGSSVTSPNRRLESLPSDLRNAVYSLVKEASWDSKPVFHTLKPGDRVRATGLFTRRLEEGTSDYRASPTGWVADGSDEHPPVSLTFAGRARIHAPSWRRSLVYGALVLGCSLGGLYGFGEYAVDNLPRAQWNEGNDPSLLDHDAAWQAALSPWHRASAASWAEHMARTIAPQTEITARRHIGLVEIRSGCRDAVLTAVQHGLVDDAIRRAAECGVPVPSAAQCREARFDGVGEAIAQSEREFRQVEGLLAGGDHERAIQAMRDSAADEREQGESSTAESAANADRLAQRWDRLADAIAARSGDTNALARLRAAEGRSALSRLLLADLASGSERVERAEALWREHGPSGGAAHALVLLAEAHPGHAAEVLEEVFPRGALLGGWRWSPDIPQPALREAISAVEAESTESRPLHALRASLRLIRVGELTAQARLNEAGAMLEAASRDLDLARAQVPEDAAPPEGLRRIEDAILLRRAGLALEAGEDERASTIAASSRAPVQRQIQEWLERRRSGLGPLSWREVPTNGREMARLLRPYDPIGQLHDPWRLRRVQNDRESLANHLRWSSDGLNTGCWPERRFERAAQEVRLALVLEQAEWGEDALARVRRFDEAFARRETAMPLYLSTKILFIGD